MKQKFPAAYGIRRFRGDSPEIESFADVARELYAGDPFWKPAAPPPPDSACYLVRRGDLAIGRACGLAATGPAWNNEPTALAGWYECADDPHAAELLLGAIADDFRQEGYRHLIGPMNGSTWHRYRFADPSDTPPFFLDVQNKPWYAAQFERAGFETIARYSSTDFDIRTGDYARVERFEEYYRNRGIIIRPFRPDDFESELRVLYDVTLASFAHNFLYTPISFENFRAIYAPIRSLIDPGLVLIAQNGEERPLGFVFTIPDMFDRAGRTLVIKTVAAAPVPEARGLGTFLVERMHLTARRRGFGSVIHALMHEDNSSMNVLAGEGQLLRTYRLFHRTL